MKSVYGELSAEHTGRNPPVLRLLTIYDKGHRPLMNPASMTFLLPGEIQHFVMPHFADDFMIGTSEMKCSSNEVLLRQSLVKL